MSGEYILDGDKLLREALSFGAEIVSVLWCGEPFVQLAPEVNQYRTTHELMRYASPLINSPGPLFTVRIPEPGVPLMPERVIVLDGVSDPGNVGTIIRTASAFSFDAVILTGASADPYNPKAARAAMGALFRQSVSELQLSELGDWLNRSGLTLYGAAAEPGARDIRDVNFGRAAIAIGSEGSGLSEGVRALCGEFVMIPMDGATESLNAAVAAAVFAWVLSSRRRAPY